MTSQMVESSLARLVQFAWSRGEIVESTRQYLPHLETGTREKSKSANLLGQEALAVPEEATGKQILKSGGKI